MFFRKKKKLPKASPKVGECFLLALKDGRYMPFQILAQRMDCAFSVCALVGITYSDKPKAIESMAQWTTHDIIAEKTIYTTGIKRSIRGNSGYESA
ncbi:hypothetical protein [Ereboglobus luteus]|uniref:Uncharacterized protein n=1 Tax=Ereboglobus luteus TaxID=1796921 RepID=A0A2U8E5Q3_9BACT|nr:hypothetical protein [Ereboglobus luteus]AWI09884.1 hypothetical protein CKA38_12050 [Ereboglobus luteus]